MPSNSAAYSRAYYVANRSALRKSALRRYKSSNSEHALSRVRVYRREFKVEIEARRLQRQFNINLWEYMALLALQDYKCSVCRRHQVEFKQALVVDHDHSCCSGERSCGKCVRGLICTSCNLLLGNAEDNIPRLEYAVAYLRRTQLCTPPK